MTAPSTDTRPAPGDSQAWSALAERSPLWARFLEVQQPTVDDLQERRRLLEHHILRDGVTHNVHAEGSTASRPWSLELLPFLIAPQEWAQVERGVRQRARLLQAMMHDLYGQQQLLRRGLLPGALLFRHPGYLRPMHGLIPALGLWLHVVAFDLARSDDGQWCVLSQRTQAPSGLGYVLHNRLLVARSFPEAFEQLRVQHIASTYRQLLATLQTAAAAVAAQSGNPTSAPRVVLWTPGPYSETHFEQAYLARYLGLPLVEGGDLTVRQQRLYLKTVDGLEPVHGVLRRLDDDWCDPLELRADSQLGVPGLLQVLRAGHLAMANAPGAGCLESPALHGFLPRIAQALLQEPLAIPSVDTWWCGESAARLQVEAAWPALRMRRTFPHAARTSQPLPSDARTRALLDTDPEGLLAQRPLPYGDAPVWGDEGLQTRPSMVRVYAIADGHGGWQVLPGGMTRVARDHQSSMSMHRGGTSLDTWVLTDGAVDTYSRLRGRRTLDDLQAAVRPVSSRTGENLFWLGRYTERLESSLPLVRLALEVCHDVALASPALQAFTSEVARVAGVVPWDTPHIHQSVRVFERALLAHAFEPEARGGACGPGYNLRAMQRAAEHLRERLSPEHWHLLRTADLTANDIHQAAQPLGGVQTREAVVEGIDRLSVLLAAITGAQTDRMTRDHGWRFLTLGRLLERLIVATHRLQCFLRGSALSDEASWDALLELSDSVITFRARHQRQLDLVALTDVLVFDDTNPRALAGILRRLRTELGKLPGEAAARAELAALWPAQGVGAERARLIGSDEADDARAQAAIAALCEQLGQSALAMADAVSQRYFTPAHAVEVRV